MIRLIRPCLIVSALLAFAAPVLLLIGDIVLGRGDDGWNIALLIGVCLVLALGFAALAGVFALLSVRRRRGG